MAEIETDEVVFEKRGVAGVITLNRPSALNALTHGMVRAMTAQLKAWAADPAIARVVIAGAGARAFCAGGDIRTLHDLGRAGRIEPMLAFWRDEYRLNVMIRRYPKPFVALIDGIVMGGGVGVSIHGSHVVAGSRFAFAMPEVGIGFFPDVGATHVLPRMPGATGTYVALTGARLGQGDALATGLATHAVPSERWTELGQVLEEPGAIDAMLEGLTGPARPPALAAHRSVIDRCFSAPTVEAVLDALDGETDEFARATAALVRTKSPRSLKIALEQVRRGRSLSFGAAMQVEYRIVSRIIRAHDFYEGVRAVIIDKDNAPRWQPPTLADVTEADVASFFEPLPDGDLEVSDGATVEVTA